MEKSFIFKVLRNISIHLQISVFRNTMISAENYRLWYACDFLVTTLRQKGEENAKIENTQISCKTLQSNSNW